MLVVPHLRPPMMIRLGIAAWLLRRAAGCSAVAGVALAGAVAHRHVGGIGGGRGRVWGLASDTAG